MRRAAAGHRGRVLRRPPQPRAATRGALRRGWRRGERSSCATCPGGCGATAWRPSTFAPPGTTVPVTTPYYREKHARRARPGLYPALIGADDDRCTEAGLRCKPRGRHAQLDDAQARSSDGIALDQDPPHRLSTLREPERRAERGVRSRTRDRFRQAVAAEGAQPIPATAESKRHLYGRRATSQTWASTARSRTRPAVVVRAADRPQRQLRKRTARPGSASADRRARALAVHRCWG